MCEALESVFVQTAPGDEIIVVDDGSDDETPHRLPAGSRVTYRRISHGGQGAARNAGLEIARREYIAFLDSDDEWEPRFLEEMTGALAANPGAGFVYCDYSTFDDRGLMHLANMPPEYKLRGSLFAALLESDFIAMGAILIRRACFARIGVFDPRLPPVEDWDLWLRLAREFDAAYVDEPLARIRVNAGNASRQPEIVYPLNLRVLAKLRRDFPHDARRYAPVLRRQRIRFHWALANYFRAQRRPLRTLEHLGRTVAARFL